MMWPRKDYPDNVPTPVARPHRWIVLRGCPGVEDYWIDLDRVSVDPETDAKSVEQPGPCFDPTDRFEHRASDGQVGLVYEYRC
jgi:hypothetical protein